MPRRLNSVVDASITNKSQWYVSRIESRDSSIIAVNRIVLLARSIRNIVREICLIARKEKRGQGNLPLR